MTHQQAERTSAAERYLLDEMSEFERHAFEAHYFSCLECAEDVRVGALMRDGVKDGLLGAASRRKVAWSASAVLPWAAAASLALVAGYQTVLVVPALNRRIAPQALSPITLRPASRGAEPVVTLGADAAAVTLAVEVNAPNDSELAYELRSERREPVASGRVPAPPAGAPLLLMLPSGTLRRQERYVLTIRASGGDVVDDYRFTVQSK